MQRLPGSCVISRNTTTKVGQASLDLCTKITPRHNSSLLSASLLPAQMVVYVILSLEQTATMTAKLIRPRGFNQSCDNSIFLDPFWTLRALTTRYTGGSTTPLRFRSALHDLPRIQAPNRRALRLSVEYKFTDQLASPRPILYSPARVSRGQ